MKKNSLRKSFSFRRRRTKVNENEILPQIDTHIGSNSNLVSNNPSASLLRRRRHSSSPPPSPSAPKQAVFEPRFEPSSDGDDDDTFSPSTNTRVRPFDRFTYRLRKSFQNTLTRQRTRLESNNSNKRLLINTNDENRKIDSDIPISTGLTSPIFPPVSLEQEKKIKSPPKRRKAPLAPTHNSQRLVSAQDLSSFNVTNESHHHEESGYSSLSDQHLNSKRNSCANVTLNNNNITNVPTTTKKSKLNRSLRTRISLLLKKRHQKHQQITILPLAIDEDGDAYHQQQQNHDENHKIMFDHDTDELNRRKSSTLGERFDTLRRSLHLGSRRSNSKGKRRLLSNE